MKELSAATSNRREKVQGKNDTCIVKVSVIVGIIETVIFRFGNQGS